MMKDLLSKRKLAEMFLRKEDRREIEEQARQQQQAIVFDQNYFDFKVEVPHCHTGLIKVEAIIVKGQKSGDKLNLKCKWYNKTQRDFSQIEDVTGCYYQPSIEDVNTSISIHAEPFMEGKQYKGVTIMKELGIIKLDDKLSQMSQQILKEEKYEVLAKLESLYLQNEKFAKIETPHEILIILNKDELKMYSKIKGNKFDSLANYEISDKFPVVEIIKKTPNSFILNVSKTESFRVSVEDNIKRDLLALTIKTFTGRKFMKQEEKVQIKQKVEDNETRVDKQDKRSDSDVDNPSRTASNQAISSSYQNDRLSTRSEKKEQSQQANLDFVLKLDQMSRMLNKCTRELEKTTEEYDNERRMRASMTGELEILRQKAILLQHLKKENETLTTQRAKLSELNNYYANEIGVYKKQIRQKQELIAQLDAQNLKLRQQQAEKQDFIRQELAKPVDIMEKQRGEIVELKEEIRRLNETYEEINIRLEQAQNDNKRLMNKCESLIQDNNNSQKSKGADDKAKRLLEQKQAEIGNLKNHIFQLEILLDKSKAEQKQSSSWSYWNMATAKDNKKKHYQTSIQSLQRLVNNLTETLTDKELQLKDQKEVNKQLMQKLVGQK